MKSGMRFPIVSITLSLAALMAAGTAGFYTARLGFSPPSDPLMLSSHAAHGAAAVGAPVGAKKLIYYRDPNHSFYAVEPRKNAEGRDYLPVYAHEDVDFETRPEKADKAMITGDSTKPKRLLYYRNPMGLPDTSPTPKKDPMGMDYIAVYEGDDDDGNIVKLGLGKLQRTGVRSVSAERQDLSVPVRASGTIQLDERRVSVVATRSDAFVDSVEDVTTGDRVHKGQALLRLYSPDIAVAAAHYLASIDFEGARQRLENLNVSAEVIAEIKRSRKAASSIVWRAPRDGIITARNVVNGMKAAPGDVLFRLADMSVVWALIDVSERDLPMVALGQSVTIRVRGFTDRVFMGKVAMIYPQLNRETRTMRVRVELANQDDILRPDMYVDAEIGIGVRAPVVTVPVSAVIDSGTRQMVIVDRGEGRFEPRSVMLGRRNSDFVEIKDGIAQGDRVVIAANFLIDAESNLKAALQNMNTPQMHGEGDAK